MLINYGLDIFIQPVWTLKTKILYKYLNLLVANVSKS